MACQLIKNTDDLRKVESSFMGQSFVAFDLEASGLNIETADLEGIGFGTGTIQYFIPFPSDIPIEEIRDFFKGLFEYRQVIFHNAKYDLQLMAKYGIPWPSKIHDTMIMSWLVDENSHHGLKALAKSIFGREPKKWKDLDRMPTLFKTQEDMVEELAEYCADDIKNTYELYFHFMPLLVNEKINIDYERVELKFIPILARMEMRGVRLDIDWLKQRAKDAEAELNDLQENMLDLLPDANVNIRSAKQLESILFDVLRYSPDKVTDAGTRSTDNEVLEKIVKDNDLVETDFVPMLLKFRELDKIYTTYLTALVEQADSKGIVHGHFLQHGTRTGRLSSNDPNLQNIPSRSDEWNVRKAFIPREGYTFIIADYSQIELRLLAHFSQDDHMVDTFAMDGDIHAKTMELTGTQRREAKTINFGLIYGMGPRSLAQQLGIKEEDAKQYIDRFFSGYPKVRFFTERVQQRAFMTGYVEMITGRRRRFNEIKDKRWYGMIKRQAINTKLQGSAADLIKIAMIKLDKPLAELGAYQLIQVHDELVIETPIDKLEEVKKTVKSIMESALTLRVPLRIGMGVGDCWMKN